MGNWIGGTYTLSATQQLGERGHRVSVITPGINVATVLENIADLGPFYDQVVLVGYPPFVKDVLDQATSDVLGQDIRLLMAGENITEYWRDYVLKRLGKEGRAEETCLIYGTADAGMIGHETATTINLRRLARNDPELDSALFGGLPIQPTFVEYDPNYRFTETDDNGYLLFTSDSAIPLIRYRINDVGRVINAPELERMLDQSGHCSPVKTSTTDAGFISLGSRPDIAATFYALKIFPESIHSALEVDGIAEFVSGKFNLITQSDEAFEQTLALHVELKSDAGFDASLIPRLHGLVVEQLSRTNSEYRQLLQTLGKQAEPTIHLHPFGTDRFTHTIKNRWVGLS
jgi:phenylacetate-CoA ligase